MQRAISSRKSGFAVSLMLSVLLHAMLAMAFFWWQQFLPEMGPVQTTYYVDVVNLPVADPRSGSPVQAEDDADVAPPPPPEPPATPAMPALEPKSRPVARQPATNSETSTAFEQRMAKLQAVADARRQAQRIEELRSKVTGSGRSGMPRGTGSEAGSDYTAYLHSRLKDAFRETISYSTKAPFVAVRLTIDTNGRLVRMNMEKSSNDKIFELSVRRAISLAEPSFTPPPGRTQYEGVFVFRPEGVAKQ